MFNYFSFNVMSCIGYVGEFNGFINIYFFIIMLIMWKGEYLGFLILSII